MIGIATHADQSNEPDLIARHFDGRIPVVTDAARGRHHTDVTRGCIQPAQEHIDGSLIADITTTRRGQGAIRSTVAHCDGAILRFHIDSASATCQEITDRILDDMAIGQNCDAARGRGDTRRNLHILVIRSRSARLQQDVTSASSRDDLVQSQFAIQCEDHDVSTGEIRQQAGKVRIRCRRIWVHISINTHALDLQAGHRADHQVRVFSH